MVPSTIARRGIGSVLLASCVVLCTGFTDAAGAKKTTAPDPCVGLLGQAGYNDPTHSGVPSPIMNWLTDSLGTLDTVVGAQAPLCSGYTYSVVLASANGSSLGWKDDTSNARTNVRGVMSPDGTRVTFSLTPADASTYLIAAGTTNIYLASPAACSPELGVYVSARITSPTGVTTYWPSNSDPTLRKLLCEEPPGVTGDGYFYS